MNTKLGDLKPTLDSGVDADKVLAKIDYDPATGFAQVLKAPVATPTP